ARVPAGAPPATAPPGYASPGAETSFPPSCREILASRTGEVRLLRVFGRHDSKTCESINCVGVSPDGRFAAYGSVDGRAVVSEARRGVELHAIRSEAAITATTFARDGTRVFLGDA